MNEIRRSREPATRVDQPWRSSSRGRGSGAGSAGSLSASPITVATPNQQPSLHSTAVLPRSVSVVSRVLSQAPAAGISSPDQAPSRRAPPTPAGSISEEPLQSSASRQRHWAGLRSEPEGGGACREGWGRITHDPAEPAGASRTAALPALGPQPLCSSSQVARSAGALKSSSASARASSCSSGRA